VGYDRDDDVLVMVGMNKMSCLATRRRRRIRRRRDGMGWDGWMCMAYGLGGWVDGWWMCAGMCVLKECWSWSVRRGSKM